MKHKQETDIRTKAWADVDIVKVSCYGYGSELCVGEIDIDDKDCIVAKHLNKYNRLMGKEAIAERLVELRERNSQDHKDLDKAIEGLVGDMDTEKERFADEVWNEWYNYDNCLHRSGADSSNEFIIEGYKHGGDKPIITANVIPEELKDYERHIDWFDYDRDCQENFIVISTAGEKGTFWNGETIWERKKGNKNRFDIDKIEFNGDGMIENGGVSICLIGSIGYDDTDECGIFLDGLSEDYETRGKSFEQEVLVRNELGYEEYYGLIHSCGYNINKVRKLLALTKIKMETELV